MNWLDFRHVKLNFCASSAQYDILDYQSTKKCEQNTLKIFISLFIFTLLYSDSLSFSDDVAKTTRTGKTRRRMCLSGNKSAKSNSNDSTAKTIRTWRISSTLFRVKDHIVIPTIQFQFKERRARQAIIYIEWWYHKRIYVRQGKFLCQKKKSSISSCPVTLEGIQ